MYFKCKSYAELNKKEVYNILALRQSVFIVEQTCPYHDADYKDQDCYHVLGEVDNKLVAYARIVPKGISYPLFISIGRVIALKAFRRKNIGLELMDYTIAQCRYIYPNNDIKISAQVYIIPFYERCGFEIIDEEYMEDNIPHIAMILKHENKK